LQLRSILKPFWIKTFLNVSAEHKDGSYGEEGKEVYRKYSNRTSFRLDGDDKVLVKWAKLFKHKA
jgi:hypothetical protein